MKSVVSVRGQTVIPKEVREALGIEPHARLVWTVEDGSAVVRAIPADPIDAAMGALKHLKFSTADLLAERRAERDKEEAQVEEMLKRWRSPSSTPRQSSRRSKQSAATKKSGGS
jgi:AbrB family looped-hinge helix DNA binding protein